MDETSKIKRESEFDAANLLSKIFFGWSLKLYLKGVKRELTLDDLSKAPNTEDAAVAVKPLRTNWENELKRCKVNNKKPNLIKILMKTYKWEAVILVIWNLFLETISVLQPLIIGVIIRYFSEQESSRTVQLSDARNAAILLCLSICVYGVLRHQYFMYTQRLAIRVRTAISVLIFDKVLKIRRTASEVTVGQFVNIFANDLNRVDDLAWFLWELIVAPISLVVVYFILWKYVGYTCLTSLVFIIAIICSQIIIARYLNKFRMATTILTDSRVKLMSEIINAMKVIKMYAWENAFAEQIAKIRVDEIKELRKTMYIKVFPYTLADTGAKILMFITIFSAILFGFKLNAEKTFVTLALFNVIRNPVSYFFPMAIGCIAENLVTFKRVKKILLTEERDGHFKESVTNVGQGGGISFFKFSSSWNSESKQLSLKEITAHIDPGELVIVIGPVGSGKTCLLMAILNEVVKVSGNCVVTGKCSYTPQEAWCFNGTVKQNIIFGREFNNEKYKYVIEVCGLAKDLKNMNFGDETLIGEKGITLSGGQKARVNLARAVYDKADIYIFDDPLSAVDSEVSNHIFHRCIKDYLKNKTRVLVTHNLQFISLADKVLIMKDGKCLAFGSPQQLISSGVDLMSMIGDHTESKKCVTRQISINDSANDKAEVNNYEEYIESKEEFSSSGAVKFKVHIDYFKAGATKFIVSVVVFSALFSQTLYQFIDYWLALWMNNIQPQPTDISVNQTNEIQTSTSTLIWVNQDNNIIFYAFALVILLIAYVVRLVSNINLCLKSSTNLHNKIFHKLLRSPISFFENNPKGRILNRFTGDVGQLDQRISLTLLDLNGILGMVIGTVVITCVVNPYLTIVCLILLAVSLPLRKYYLRSVRNVKRYEAITRSPVFNCVSTTFDGLTCIRAFQFENKFEEQFRMYVNDNNACRYLLVALARSFGFILDWCTIVFFICLTSLLFVGSEYISGGEVGLILSSALTLINEFQFSFRWLSEYETQMISAERVLEYTKLSSEAPLSIEGSNPPANWPSKGAIIFHHVFLRYNDSSQPILQDLCFNVESGSKVGIVGRTGAGKSSIINAMFRLVEFDGIITIDGIDIKKLGLNDLRKKLSIIPQDPVLFQGTIRRNIDPYNEYSDEVIWRSLQSVKLEGIFKAIPGELNAAVTENGSNLSVGQRQLVCMVRALLRNNKILVMDEATANIDHETDSLIQTAIKECLQSCTVVTIAHRLNTVIDMDKILVIEAGRIIEFDSPYNLLNKSDGHFKRMVLQLGDNSAASLFDIANKRFKSHS